jgi:1-acyl-sn-glycerol-3-phosphate acyltransferase
MIAMVWKAIQSALIWLFLAVWTILEFIPFIIIYPFTLLFDRKLSFAHWITTIWGIVFFSVNPLWKITVEGREKSGTGGPYVIAPNHESMGDILVLFHLRTHFKWIAKRVLFFIPLMGWAMGMAGDIPLVRGDRGSIRRCMRKAAEWLRRGVSVMIFPEGTRSRTGKLRAFKPGAFRLALETGRPILPVVLVGTFPVLPKKSWILKEKAHVRMRVLDPIDPEPFAPGDCAGYSDHVRAIMAEAKAELENKDPAEVVE